MVGRDSEFALTSKSIATRIASLGEALNSSLSRPRMTIRIVNLH